MRKRSVGRFGRVLAGVATLAAIAALPAPAADSGTKCGPVTAGDIGAAEVTAHAVGCGKARRTVRRCIGEGHLRSGWTASANGERGKLKLTKDEKKIVAVIEGGFTNTLRACLAESSDQDPRVVDRVPPPA